MTAAYGRQLQEGGGLHYYSPQFRRTLNGLGALRFNRAVSRGMYQLPFHEPAPSGTLGRMGQGLEVDPTTLLWGVGILGLGMFLLGKRGKKKSKPRRKRARLPHLSWE